MKITFVHSPEDYYDQNYGTQFTPLWAYYLAAYIPEHWEIEIADCRLEGVDQFSAADIFAFSGINQDLNAMTQTMQKLKKRFPKATCLLGGPIAWSFEREGKLDLLRHFDYIFILDGEESLPKFLQHFEAGSLNQLDQIIKSRRYPFSEAKKIRLDLMDQKQKTYYGAVIEASRGCPFLCEFCDIRVLPGNNQSNNKNIALFIAELDEYYNRGVKKFQVACDNFIGDTQWADHCLDAILAWKEKRGADISMFTWLTINIFKMPRLMTKMRQCGFSILFIGIESVNRNSLLETAKVQNLNVLEEAVKTIHSYGFIIAPGLIFGFDSDPETIFKETLDFLSETGTIGGDPSFLTALAGTPLYARMKKSGRLVEFEEGAIERKKIMTNIRYLRDKDFLANGFVQFTRNFTNAHYQFSRFQKHVALMAENSRFIPVKDSGYASPWPYLKQQIKNFHFLSLLVQRIFYLLRPDRFWFVLKAWFLTKKYSARVPSLSPHLFYWLYVWTNMVLKYKGLKPSDFSIHCVDKNFDRSGLALAAMPSKEEIEESHREGVKMEIQHRFTHQALQQLAEGKGSAATGAVDRGQFIR